MVTRDDNGYLFRYDVIGERSSKNGIPNPSPFHDIFTVKQSTGETQRVHYAVDDHGIRANLHSNSVRFGKNIDTSSIHFGSRLRGLPVNKFDTVLHNTPEKVPILNEPVVINPEARPSELELSPPPFVPLRHPPEISQNFGINAPNREYNQGQKSPEEYIPPPPPALITSDPSIPIIPTDLRYEPERIANPNTTPTALVPVVPEENLSLNVHRSKEQNLKALKDMPVSKISELKGSEVIPRDLPTPRLLPQLQGYGLRQDQISNTAGLQWYQSFPPQYPPIDPAYNLPFYPVDNAYESQRIGNQGQYDFFPSSNILPSTSNPPKAPNSNIRQVTRSFKGPSKSSGSNISPQSKTLEYEQTSDQYLGEQDLKNIPKTSNVPNSGVKLASNSINKPAKSLSPDVSFQSQIQEFYPNSDQYFGAGALENAQKALKPPNSVVKSASNTFYEPSKSLDPGVSLQSQKQEFYPKSNQLLGAGALKNTPNALNDPNFDIKSTSNSFNNQEKYSGPDVSPQSQKYEFYPHLDQYFGAGALENTPNAFNPPNSEVKSASNFNEPTKSSGPDVSFQLQKQEFHPKSEQYFGAGALEVTPNTFSVPNAETESDSNSFNGPTKSLGPKISFMSQEQQQFLPKHVQTLGSRNFDVLPNEFNSFISGAKIPNTNLKSLEGNVSLQAQTVKQYSELNQYYRPQMPSIQSFKKVTDQFVTNDFAINKSPGYTENTNVDILKFQLGSTKQPIVQYPLRHNFPVKNKSDNPTLNRKDNTLQNSKSLIPMSLSKDSEAITSGVQLRSTKQTVSPTPNPFPVTYKSDIPPLSKHSNIFTPSKLVTPSYYSRDTSATVTKIPSKQPTSIIPTQNLFPINSKTSMTQVSKSNRPFPVTKSQTSALSTDFNAAISKTQLFSTSQSPALGQMLHKFSPKNKLDTAELIIKNGPSSASKSLTSSPLLKNKNSVISTMQPVVLSPVQKLISNNSKTEIIPVNRKNVPFPQTKSLISSPMATIFDTAKENGQYYHYIMNVGSKNKNNDPSGIKIPTTGNLFKILNGTRTRQPIGNLKQLMEKFNRYNGKDNQNQIKQTPRPLEEKKKVNIKNSINETKTNYIMTSDVTEGSQKTEDIPTVTASYVIFDVDELQFPNKIISEIEHIVNTEEPLSSTTPSNDYTEKISTSTKPASEEPATSSFLTELFDVGAMDNIPSTEDSASRSEKLITTEENIDADKELTSLFITVPETSLTSLFSEKLFEQNDREQQEITSHVTLQPEKTTIASKSDLEITTVDELKEYLNLTPTTPSTYETSFSTEELVPSRETTSTFEISTETARPQSTISSTEKHESTSESVTTTMSPITTELTSITTISPVTYLSTTETSTETTESRNEITNNPSDSIIVDVINTDSSTTGSETPGTAEYTYEQESKTESSEQQKPMLELVIQNTEMNDFMSRINNMPIMIRVVNPKTTTFPTTTETPITEEVTTTNNDIAMTTESSNEITRDSYELTEITPEIPTTIMTSSLEDVVQDTSISPMTTTTALEKSENEQKQQTNTVSSTLQSEKLSNYIDFSSTTLISEPISTDAMLLTTEVIPSTSKSITESQSTLSTTEEQNTSTLKNEKSDFTEMTDTQTPEDAKYTLITPVDSTMFDPSGSNHENIIHYATKLAESLEKFQTEKSKDYHEEESTVFVPTEGDLSTTIESTDATEPVHVIPVFFESDEARAPEESQNIENFKTLGSRFGDNNPLIRPNQFSSFPQQSNIKNSSTLNFEKVTNYKGYEKAPLPVDYVDYASYKDIDYNSQLSVGGDSKFPSDAIYVLDDYDVLSSNPVDQQGDYIFVGSNGNFGSNVMPTNILTSSADLNDQPVYIIDSTLPKFGSRFQQEINPVIDLSQLKVKGIQEPLPRDFQNFRSSKSYDIKSKLNQDQWYPSKQ
ncbi:uncharacterized protein NPIL_58971 [Nephila pilipes]|uniref:Uncharacterized protein n=1 Tax=Nephila pilipes TaxID=299642 RepID=A0A8X6Q0N0_NEPPI|nr:uncharacterized protein NPIL_58971 [Nephila pilipes]